METIGAVCGTGSWRGPKPGDPDNFSILTATPAFGGIDVNWTYPLTNPHAVAHTIVYRHTHNDFDGAIRIAVVDGDHYFDKTTTENLYEYFYWIQFVSINGTYGEIIGPESATARPAIDEVIEQLTGKIDAGVLSQSLQQEIARIEDLEDGLTQEMLLRQEDFLAIGQAFNALQTTVDDFAAIVTEEIEARTTFDSALAQQINTIQAAFGDELASVQVEMGAHIDTLAGEVTSIGSLYTVKVDVNGLVGGFGVYNDGTEIEAGFDVDRFWVGKTSQNKRKPFIIQNNETFIDEAVINRLTISKLRDESGSFVVENNKIKADYITIGTGQIKNAHIEHGAINNAKILDGAITNAKIADGAITNAKIGDAAITTAKIGTAQVDRLRIAEGAVTLAHNTVFAAGSGDFPKEVWTNHRSFSFQSSQATRALVSFDMGRMTGSIAGILQARMLLNGVVLHTKTLGGTGIGTVEPTDIFMMVNLRAGTNTFTMQKWKNRNGYSAQPGVTNLAVICWYR